MMPTIVGRVPSQHQVLQNGQPLRLGARAIEAKKYRKVLDLLKKWRIEETMQNTRTVPMGFDSGTQPAAELSQTTLSVASKTNTQDLSLSPGTSVTDFTGMWSVKDGSEQQESTKKELTRAMKARKAFFRCLGACPDGCRKRRVKCFSSHHALETLLDGRHTADDQENVRWAFLFDWDSEKEPFVELIGPCSTVSDQHQPPVDIAPEFVVDQASHIFNTYSTESFYPPEIPDIDFVDDQSPSHGAHLPQILEMDESSFDFGRVAEQIHAGQTEPTYSMEHPVYDTESTPNMLLVGRVIFGYDQSGQPAFEYFQCVYDNFGPDRCLEMYTSKQGLLSHVQLDHFDFNRLPRDLRLRCSDCLTFYPQFTHNRACLNAACSPLDLQLEVYGERTSYTILPWEPATRNFVPRSFRNGRQGRGWSQNQVQGRNGYHNAQYGAGNPYGYHQRPQGGHPLPGGPGYGAMHMVANIQNHTGGGFQGRTALSYQDVADTSHSFNPAYKFYEHFVRRYKLTVALTLLLIILIIGAERQDLIHRHLKGVTLGPEAHTIIYVSVITFAFVALRVAIRSPWIKRSAPVLWATRYGDSFFSPRCTQHLNDIHDYVA